MIELYSKEMCPFCVRAKNLCEDNNLEHEVYMLNTDFVREDIHLLFPSAKTYPVVVIDGEYIGGCVELEKMYNE